jgi:hypothetical protein
LLFDVELFFDSIRIFGQLLLSFSFSYGLMDLSLHCLYSVGVGHTGSFFFFAMAILLLGGNLDDLVEIVTDTEWGEARLKFCYF